MSDVMVTDESIVERTRLPKLIYLLFVIQGVGTLLPWNFFITANGYYSFKFQDDVYFKDEFENAFSVSSQIPCACGLLVNLYLTERGTISRNVRVNVCLIITTLCFVLTAALVDVNSNSWTKTFFAVTIITIVINNFCIGVFQGTIFGIAGTLGGTLAVMRGMGIAGIFSSFANIMSLLFSNSVHTSAFGYFASAACITLICIPAYSNLVKTQLFQIRFRDVYVIKDKPAGFGRLLKNTWDIFKEIYPLAGSVCLIFTVSTAIMPSIIGEIRSTNASNGSEWTNRLFSDFSGFLIFNCGDFAGRIAAGYVQIVRGKALYIMSASRVLFIPLYMLCNYQPRNYLPVIFHEDYIPIVINALFSLTNGYFASLCMMYAPQSVSMERSETAGALMQLSLSIGLCLGAALSYIIVLVI